MARFTRGGRRGGSQRGGRRGGKPRGHTQRNNFTTSRIAEEEDVAANDEPPSEDDLDLKENAHDEDPVSGSEEDEAEAVTNSYATLLQALNANMPNQTPSRKKRKLNGELQSPSYESKNGSVQTQPTQNPDIEQEEDIASALHEPETVSDQDEDDASGSDSNDDDDETVLSDPFQQHYAAISGDDVTGFAKAVGQQPFQPRTELVASDIRKTWLPARIDTNASTPLKQPRDLHLKSRLKEGGAKLFATLSPDEKYLAGSVFAYEDVLCGFRTIKNSTRLRDICALHALNHIFKTRDHVLRNNTKLNQPGNEDQDHRDQGFTRPKVLVIVPTKQSCVRFVEGIVKYSEPDQQENKSRFLDTYSREEEDEWENKPEDFRELFGGNHDEDFRIGLKFTRKTIKFFSGFYNSDIIIGSPLGLMRTITTGGGGGVKDKTKKKSYDADFLSSIEVVIADHAAALQMQNWQHVDYVFSQLNQLPKESHGCDFSRVRNWYLDGHAKHLRQTIILSSYLTPEVNALASSHLHNMAGRVKYLPVYPGAMLSVANILPMPVHQTFIRFDSSSAVTDSERRFKYFTATILPALLREAKHSQKGVLIFVPTYLDFVTLRNHFSTSTETTSLAFGSVSEYTEVKDVARARSHFVSGRHSVLLYSERAHHHFRYRLRGVRKVIFYGVPENPIFWSEVVGLLGLTPELVSGNNAAAKGKGLVRAMFSKWDAMKLERIVGSERIGKLMSEKGGDTFDFV